MLRSSLGFHTMSMFLRLTREEAERLIGNFYNYCVQTGEIRMRISIKLPNGKIEWKEYKPKLSGKRLILPYELHIGYSDWNKDRGIRWRLILNNQNMTFTNYIVEVTINPKILSKNNDYITAADCGDLFKAAVDFNNISGKISPLLVPFEKYYLKRVDYCVNFSVNELAPGCTIEQIIILIKRGDIPSNYKEYTEYDDKSHRKKSSPDSFYLESKSITINCYRKSKELQDRREKGSTIITQEIINEAEDIIRFEVQCKYHKVYSLLKSVNESTSFFNKYSDLLGYKACLLPINCYYKVTIGAGDWYSLSEAQKIIEKCGFNKQKAERLLNVLREVSQCRSLAEAKAKHQDSDLAAFKRTVKDLADIGINPVTIPREWSIKHIPNLLHTFLDMDHAREFFPEIPLI